MNRALIEEASSVIYSTIVGVSWVVCPHLKGLVLFLSNILILLVIIVFLNMTLGDSVLRRMVPLLRFSVDNRGVSHNVINIYYLNFLIRVFFNKVALLSIL